MLIVVPEEDRIVTEWFSVPAIAIVKALTLRKGWGWLIVAGVLPFIPLGIFLITLDTRWLLVALMILLIVVPSLLFFLYFSYALTPEVARAVLPHRLIIDKGKSVCIEYEPHDEMRVPAPETIPWDRIALLKQYPDYWILLKGD